MVIVDFDIEDKLFINIDNEEVVYCVVFYVLNEGDNVVIFGFCLIDLFFICCIYDSLLIDVDSLIVYCWLDGYLRVVEEKNIMVSNECIWYFLESDRYFVR